MAYGRRNVGRRGYRRRLGGSKYANVFGYKAVPFTRKRPYPFRPGGGSTTALSAPPRMGRRVRPRNARSYTQTKTQTKPKFGRVTTHGDNASFSKNLIGSIGVPRGLRGIYRQLAAPQTVVDNASGAYASTTGTQRVIVLSSAAMFTNTMLNGIKASIASTDRAVRFFLRTGRVKLTLRNQTNCNARVSIYDLLTSSSAPSSALDTPLEVWEKGLADYGGTFTPITIGATPFKSPEFRRQFKIHKVTTLSMEPGQQHEHTVYHKYNRLIDSNQFDNWTTTLSIKGLTRWTMFVFHGSLVHESASSNVVTYAPVTLDYAVHREYSYSWIEKAVPSLSATDNLAKTLIDPDQMGETGDADVNVNTA